MYDNVVIVELVLQAAYVTFLLYWVEQFMNGSMVDI